MPAGDSAGGVKQAPIAGRAIATAAWRRYSDVTARFKAGKATVGEMVSARREYDAAQEGIEQAAQRESVSWRRSTRR